MKIQNPFENGHIKNYLLAYISVVVIMILFFLVSTLFHDVEHVEKKEFKNLEVLTYLVDEEFYVNIIDKYTVFEDKLMIDYSGIYSTDLIKKYDESYENNYLDKPRLDKDYFNSLVKFNFFRSYFSKEGSSINRWDFIKREA